VPVLFSGFTAFLFRQYFLNFPRSLEEAARVDGLGYLGVYWRMIVPDSSGATSSKGSRRPASRADRSRRRDRDRLLLTVTTRGIWSVPARPVQHKER
jgi:hypothetical protein